MIKRLEEENKTISLQNKEKDLVIENLQQKLSLCFCSGLVDFPPESLNFTHSIDLYKLSHQSISEKNGVISNFNGDQGRVYFTPLVEEATKVSLTLKVIQDNGDSWGI